MVSRFESSHDITMRWERWHAFAMLIALPLAILTGQILLFFICATGSFGALILANFRFLRGLKPFGGYANRVTFLRWLILVLSCMAYPALHDLFFFACILLVVILDWADGYLARRFNQESAFGAIFDMDTDGLFAAVLSLVLFWYQDFGAWILVAGFFRYGFVLLKALTPLRHVVLGKPHRFAKEIAVVYFIALLLPFLFNHAFAKWILMVASGLIVVSFILEFRQMVLKKRELR